MYPKFLKVSTEPNYSFSVRKDNIPHVNNQHYHAHIELIHFKNGAGTQFVGDSIAFFKPGDVVLVGANLPHYWHFDTIYPEGGHKMPAYVRVVYFCEDFWSTSFLQLPENAAIKLILEKCRRSLHIKGNVANKVAGLLEKLLEAKDSQRLILLLPALELIANSNEVTFLSSIGFKYNLADIEKNRINDIYE